MTSGVRKEDRMSQYLVESHHTKEECLRELDALSTKPELLARFSWACASGDHTGYGLIEASSEKDAREVVPDFVRSKAEVIPVTRMSPEQIRSLHAK
jgi:hypothetical protein